MEEHVGAAAVLAAPLERGGRVSSASGKQLTTICISADVSGYIHGGGHLWAYLNWALGFREAGCDVIWLEGVYPHGAAARVQALRRVLRPFGLDSSVAVYSRTPEPIAASRLGCMSVDEAAEASELLLNLRYDLRAEIVGRFRRTVLVDIDPGLLQVWARTGGLSPPAHDTYITTGAAVAARGHLDLGIEWVYSAPPVSLVHWPVTPNECERYTTVSHWWGGKEEINGRLVDNSKRAAFLDFVELPRRVPTELELALCLSSDEDSLEERLFLLEEQRFLEENGWKVAHAHDVSSTPQSYRAYIQRSRGEFSCVKASCVILQSGWIGDRTPCYLASGRPVVIQHTGPIPFLDGSEGFLRFRSLAEAADALAAVEARYEQHARRARELAEEYFDARKVAERVLERAL